MRKNKRVCDAIAKKILHKRTIQCKNKVRYTDINMALAGAMSTLESNNRKGNKLYYYKCDICNGYHLTRNPGGGKNTLCNV